MPFSISLVARVLDDVERQRVLVGAGISNGTVSGLDHDVLVLNSVGVFVGVLVEAVVGDILSDLHAVQSHVSESDCVSIVSDLLGMFQVVDEESPFVDEIHLSSEEFLGWSDAGLDLLLSEDAFNLEGIRFTSHVRINPVGVRFDIWVTELEVFAVLGGERFSTIWFLVSLKHGAKVDKLLEDGSFGVFLVFLEGFSFFALVVSVSITEHWCFDVAWDWREDG